MKANDVKRLAAQHARPRRIQRALARLREKDPVEGAALTAYHLYVKPVIERTSKALAELEPARRRQVLEIVVAACGGTIQWR